MVTWRRLNNVQIKQTFYHIRNTVKYWVKTCDLNGMIPNDSEKAINVGLRLLVHIRDKIDIAIQNMIFFVKIDFSDTIEIC